MTNVNKEVVKQTAYVFCWSVSVTVTHKLSFLQHTGCMLARTVELVEEKGFLNKAS